MNALYNHARFATMEAMDKQRAFSWTKGRNAREVQHGVYIRHSQDFFHTYCMNKAS